jgi:ABC-type transporter MlaC component
MGSCPAIPTYVVVFVLVTFTDGIVSPHNVLVVRQSGHWRVRDVPFWGVS